LGLLGGALLAVSLASVGAGLYALCLSGLVKRLVFLSDLLLVYRWHPTWAWSLNTYAPAWRFGLTRVASTLFTTGQKLLESSVFIHLVGFANFGIYGRAVGLASMVCAQFAALVMQAIYPVLTKIEPGREVYGHTSALALRSVAWIVIPSGILGTRLAEPIVRLLYGEAWTQTIPLLPWAMAAGTAGALTYTVYMLALAGEHKRGCLWADLWMSLGTGANLACLLPHGIHFYLMGSCMLQIGGLLFLCRCLYGELRRVVVVLIDTIITPLIATSGAWLLCESVRYHVEGRLDDISTACLYSIGFGILYIVLLRALATTQFDELLSQLPGARYLHRVRMWNI
jgi:O-antigen/teichoic acid export membrane protein